MSHTSMNCDEVRKDLALLVYGELGFEEEDAVEQHLLGCEGCRAERAKLEKLDSLMEQGEMPVPPELLLRCRQDLSNRIRLERTGDRLAESVRRFWQRWVVNPPMWMRPVGALAMLAIGFLGARMIPMPNSMRLLPVSSAMYAPDGSSPVASRIRVVNPDDEGRVRLVVEETREREVTGAMDDHQIQRLLMVAATDQSDPGLRVESVGLLKDHCANAEIRQALLTALQNDPNSGVRLKALEGLKPFAREAQTRKALAHVLLTDDNPGVRTMAVDLLVQSKDANTAGVLQEVLRKEGNSYVRSRSQRALSEMKASVGTF